MIVLELLKKRELFTNTELVVCQYIIDNPKRLTTISLSELSKVTFSSQATIVRLCKKLGFSGYADFKIHLAMELSTFLMEHDRIKVNVPFAESATDEEIIDTFYNLTFQTLKDTYNSININLVRRAARMICNADSVVLYGRGESLIIMEDFRHKLMRIGIHADAEILNGFEGFRTRQKNHKEVAFVVSYYVDSAQVRDVFDELSYQKVPIIVICGETTNPLIKKAKLVINVDSVETRYKIGAFASRTAMQFVFDCLYGIVFSMNYEENLEYIRQVALRNIRRGKYTGENPDIYPGGEENRKKE